jgi:peptide methionine sulfoxide reductase msrA/msrB
MQISHVLTSLAAAALLALFAAGAVAVVKSAGPAAGAKESLLETTKAEAVSGAVYSRSGHDVTPLTKARIEELAKDLTPEERRIILAKGTEPSFCGDLTDNKTSGTYVCRLCALPLFDHNAKFDSGTGWPSYDRPIDKDHVRYVEDKSIAFMPRIEILGARCDGHLGHVFDDGPTDTGMRYCLNSASLDFVEEGQPMPKEAQPVEMKQAYFAGGCFWGIEHYFQKTIPGVISVESGYQGGTVDNPTYKQVCYEDTNHAESVRIVYDPARVTYRTLLETFFKIHDPTQVNRQGPDVGTQYRSAIFAADDEQFAEAEKFLAEQATRDRFKGKKIATQLSPYATFWEAEDFHQDYKERTGRACYLQIYED